MAISDENTRYPLTINKKLKELLEEISREENRTLNNLIITILTQYIKTEKGRLINSFP